MSESSEISIAVGFRFTPTEKELMCEYLAKKVWSCSGNDYIYKQFSSTVVIECSEVYCKHPWLLMVSTEGATHRMERDGAVYFFVRMTKKNANGWRPNRRINGDMGFWKSTSSGKPVVDNHGNVLGMKKSLKEGDDDDKKTCSSNKNGSKTSWIMHEYNLVDPKNPNKKEFQEWTLCRINNSGRKSSSCNTTYGSTVEEGIHQQQQHEQQQQQDD
ncbi:NAC domain-containing protein JA2L-like [Telopea speciosissima]|uniref:NAC domain-containing protein JA2L-like n=1 Tax=Telopea speciosissima TaxID=54955 RepID=UPI001CC62704|nr:NAC domain-containing protein JA2L-like [Telopea speciosissima]